MSQMPHPSHDVPGTLRRAPAPSFAHALCLDQGVHLDTGHNHPLRWQISDAYGRMDNTLTHDDDVADWPVVYIPATTEAWTEKTSRLPAPRHTSQHDHEHDHKHDHEETLR